MALDIESSTTRSNPLKADLRIKLYELFEAALRSAGINSHHRDQLIDRGDGLLMLIHPVDDVPKTLPLNRVIPALSQLLTDYNASLPVVRHPQRQLRLRAVLHAGEVHYDANGCFGEALDIAFRLLDASQVKQALQMTSAPLILVISDDIFKAVVRHGYDGIDPQAFDPFDGIQIAGHRYRGWVHVPEQPPHRHVFEIAEYRQPA